MDQRREKCHILLLDNQLNPSHLFTCGLVLTLFLVVSVLMPDASALFLGSISCFRPACPGNLLIVPSLRLLPVCSCLPEFFAEDYQPLGLFLGIFLNTGFFDDQRRFVNKIQSPAKFSFVTERSSSFMFVYQNNDLNRKYGAIFHHPWSSW